MEKKGQPSDRRGANGFGMAERIALKPHPGFRHDAVTGIDVEVARPAPGALLLHYILAGAIPDLRLPPPAGSVRADGLWRHTCFEAFIRASGKAYHELNFSPSRQWAAYRFGGYRKKMAEADLDPPRIETRADADRFELRALVAGLSAGPLQLGLSAVIEETSGRLSYWALAHPPGKPDFHHSDCFALQLPPAV